MEASTELRYNHAVEQLRDSEFPMIRDSVYLDHAGSTLCSKTLMDSFAHEMTSTLYGNPHSGSPSSQQSTSRIEDARMNLLEFFGADPDKYDLVFVANATAGVKLVVDAMRAQPQGWLYAYHQACHTSLIGAREEAFDSVCLDDDAVRSWLDGTNVFGEHPEQPQTVLFSYSAQSHMNGKRYPLAWSKDLKEVTSSSASRVMTLLDASSFSATSRLDLGNSQLEPDFVVLSLYKIFGFPDLGALIVHRSAASTFDHRKYFGGGTVDTVVVGKERWHAPKSQFLHEKLEDGTLPFHNIIALDMAIKVHKDLYGSMDQISSHTSFLRQRLQSGLEALRHANKEAVCTMYTEKSNNASVLGIGPIVSFNLKNSMGAWISLHEFEKLAILKKMHIRTGGLCSPGDIASTLDLQPWELKSNFSAGFRCGTENDIISGKPTGVIRASLGAMSTISDVDRFVEFVREFYVETQLLGGQPHASDVPTPRALPGMRVKAVTVFPIKSCAGFSIPSGKQWDIRPEGLAWDREWCLIHQGSGFALNQKRCPKMALMQPALDFDKGLLTVTYRGEQPPGIPSHVSIPLSADPAFIDTTFRQLQSRVCGETISAQIYVNESINEFFSKSLGVPCILARFPPGGRGLTSRASKAKLQRHQQQRKINRLPGAFPEMPSPPDSDSEQQRPANILLSNESPILMINTLSVGALNQEITRRGGDPVTESSFRANIILEPADDMKGQLAFAEDDWSSVQIGNQPFKLLGACRRCQMVCIDQQTGEKREEPYITLAKTRRFDGRVFFGVHMRHNPTDSTKYLEKEMQHPAIQVGATVLVETRE